VNRLSGLGFAQVPDEPGAATVLFGKARQSVHHGPRFIRSVRVHIRAQVRLDRVNNHKPCISPLQRIAQEPDIGKPHAAPRTAQEVRAALDQFISDVRARRLDPKVAGTLGYLANVLLKSIEVSDVEERLAALESGLGAGVPQDQQGK